MQRHLVNTQQRQATYRILRETSMSRNINVYNNSLMTGSRKCILDAQRFPHKVDFQTSTKILFLAVRF